MVVAVMEGAVIVLQAGARRYLQRRRMRSKFYVACMRARPWDM